MIEEIWGPLFRDRKQAAGLLAGRLAAYQGQRPLVLGIPRGGVIMARIIADALQGDLDVVLVRKLRDPDHPELAIGAVTESGHVFLADRASVQAIPNEYVEREAAEALAVLRRRRADYTPFRPPVDPAGRITLIVDDGIATGATVMAALSSLREVKAARLVVAAAVAPAHTARALGGKADEVVCLAQPEDFSAVSQFFADFSEVSDDDVLVALRRSEARRAG